MNHALLKQQHSRVSVLPFLKAETGSKMTWLDSVKAGLPLNMTHFITKQAKLGFKMAQLDSNIDNLGFYLTKLGSRLTRVGSRSCTTTTRHNTHTAQIQQTATPTHSNSHSLQSPASLPPQSVSSAYRAYHTPLLLNITLPTHRNSHTLQLRCKSDTAK